MKHFKVYIRISIRCSLVPYTEESMYIKYDIVLEWFLAKYENVFLGSFSP